jgi:hypothetical protein
MIPKKIGTMQTVDVATGKVVAEKKNAMMILPPAGDVCQVCATDHKWDEPHNQQSLYYQMRFHSEHGRYPTWTDAMAHCTPEVQAAWKRQLVDLMIEKGLDVPPDLWTGPAAGR